MKTCLGIDIRPAPNASAAHLRNGLTACVWARPSAASPSAPFPLLGIDEQGYLHSWTQAGSFTGNGDQHDMDLVPFAPAPNPS